MRAANSSINGIRARRGEVSARARLAICCRPERETAPAPGPEPGCDEGGSDHPARRRELLKL